jgi:coenzyme Q-binding protein COQ10
MPKHFEQRLLPFTPEQLFALVANIESYPIFLPWCLKARVLERRGNNLTAEMVVGTKALREKFTSNVTLNKPKGISVHYRDGPLRHLSNEWRFAPGTDGGCEVTFTIDFGFRSSILGALMNAFFDKASRKMVSAFEARARELYG